ncbi:MAG TPA: CDGSH iron-sulfur domain-containing protein [Steroidobacteraceae bacterium]|jgi:CDGSH-type Zn-finger protein/uncharacterized Fe-S cluster protein YjdI|nr:CDGSH iron-sulfur domain-containing protein [Steroidobacteraceae bacterium]HNS26614.1 CDGSH iron-sulfur domain-containing protein [Steroidobacteraceae bacterium]
MSSNVERAPGEKLTVQFEARKCIRSRHCVLGDPRVFVPNADGEPNVEGEWIHPDAASVDAVVEIAHKCPSGAITYERIDGGPQEAPPPVNVVRVRENGPLAFHAEMHFYGGGSALRAALCRCGASKSKPFCDTSHADAGFAASGEAPTRDSPALAVCNGPLEVIPVENGPLHVKGNLEVVTGTGRTVERVTECWLCRCGGSGGKPFCDGTHRRIGFTAAGLAPRRK